MTLIWISHRWGLETRCRRFVLTRTTRGYSLVDRTTQEIIRTHTIQVAKAVASLRVDEPIVHHSNSLYA